jgi:hypothetical protein
MEVDDWWYTMERRRFGGGRNRTIEPSDIRAVELECLRCHARKVLFLKDYFNGNGRCSNCGASWPLQGIAAFQGLQKIVSSLLLQAGKINRDNTIPFAVRFKLVPDSEKFKP